MLDNADIQTFKTLYQNRFGVVLSDEEAREAGERVVRLVRVVRETERENIQEKIQHYENNTPAV